MKNPFSQMAALVCGSLLTSVLALSSAHGQPMTWDSNAATAPNPNDGAGTWSIVGNPTTSANWWDGTTNVVWDNTNHANTIAVFGTNSNTGLAGAINLGANTINAGGLRFDEIKLPAAAVTGPPPVAAGTEEAYSFTNGTINLANNALIDVRANTSTSNTIPGRLRFGSTSHISGENVTITNASGGNTTFGIMQFAGSNSWSGVVTFTGNSTGGLFAEATTAAALNTASKIVVNNGATLALNYGSAGTNNKAFELSGIGSANRGALRFDQSLTLGGTIKLNGDTRIGTNTSASIIGTLAGDISGNFDLSVASNVIPLGTVVFKGNNTYKNLNINRGNAQIGEGGVGTSGTGTVTVNLTPTTGAIAYVSGTGQIKENLIITNGQVRPGDTGGASVGTLNVTGNVTFNSSTNITAGQFQLTTGGVSDKLAAAGAINLSGNGDLSVIFQSYSTIVNGDSWTILQGAGGINYGTFNVGTDLRTGADGASEADLNLPDLTAIAGYNGQLWQITNGANALVVTIVPEPSAVLLSGLGIVAIGLRRRRK